MYKPFINQVQLFFIKLVTVNNFIFAFFFITFLFNITSASSQSVTDKLIDSLAFVESHAEKARLGQEIAKGLCDTDWQRAIKYLEYAEEEAKASNSDETLAVFYNTAGEIYSDKDVMDVALEYYQKAYKIYVKLEDEENMLVLENNLAVIYGRMNNKEMALAYFKKSYTHLQVVDNNDSVSLSILLNNIATLYIENNQDSSISYYNKSLDIANSLNNSQLFAYLYSNLGRVWFFKNDTAKARYYIEKSISVAKNSPDDDSKIMVYQQASKFFLNIGIPDSAIYYAGLCSDLLKNDPYSFSNQDVVQTLYKAWLAKEDYKNASKYFEQYDQIRDSINVEEKAINIERLKLKMEYDTKEEIRKLKDNRRRLGYIITGLSLISGLLFLIIILVRNRNRLSKVQLEKELSISKSEELKMHLESKNRALIVKAMSEIQREEIIKGILEELKEVKLKAVKKETQETIDYISQRLKKNINSDNWKEFEMNFEQVHEAFYVNLNNKHPDLTSNDRRLCALLKLNLNSKEIAQITGQSFKAVENSRTRLRKKMNITNTKTDLVVYLNSFN